jgi:phosphocarrier protein
MLDGDWSSDVCSSDLSIMGVMMLAAGKGSKVTLETDGADEAEAMEALLALIADYFGEGE